MTRPRWARVLLAAVRLAAIYAAGVLILLLPLIVWRRGDFGPHEQPWLKLSVAGLVCFGFGFVALAAVKRLGFVVLWGLLLWQWIGTVEMPQVLRIEDPTPVSYYTKTLQGYAYAAWPCVIVARELGRVVGALWRSRGDGRTA